MSESQFSRVAEAAIQTIIDEQSFDPQAQTAYRIASAYPLEIWEARPPNLCCDDKKIAPKLLFSVSAPPPLKRRRSPKVITRALKPTQFTPTSPLVEVFPVVIPTQILAFCQLHPEKVLNIKLVLASGVRGWIGARLSHPIAEGPSSLVVLETRKARPPDFWMLEALLKSETERVDPALMRKLLLKYG